MTIKDSQGGTLLQKSIRLTWYFLFFKKKFAQIKIYLHSLFLLSSSSVIICNIKLLAEVFERKIWKEKGENVNKRLGNFR